MTRRTDIAAHIVYKSFSAADLFRRFGSFAFTTMNTFSLCTHFGVRHTTFRGVDFFAVADHHVTV